MRRRGVRHGAAGKAKKNSAPQHRSAAASSAQNARSSDASNSSSSSSSSGKRSKFASKLQATVAHGRGMSTPTTTTTTTTIPADRTLLQGAAVSASGRVSCREGVPPASFDLNSVFDVQRNDREQEDEEVSQRQGLGGAAAVVGDAPGGTRADVASGAGEAPDNFSRDPVPAMVVPRMLHPEANYAPMVARISSLSNCNFERLLVPVSVSEDVEFKVFSRPFDGDAVGRHPGVLSLLRRVLNNVVIPPSVDVSAFYGALLRVVQVLRQGDPDDVVGRGWAEDASGRSSRSTGLRHRRRHAIDAVGMGGAIQNMYLHFVRRFPHLKSVLARQLRAVEDSAAEANALAALKYRPIGLSRVDHKRPPKKKMLFVNVPTVLHRMQQHRLSLFLATQDFIRECRLRPRQLHGVSAQRGAGNRSTHATGTAFGRKKMGMHAQWKAHMKMVMNPCSLQLRTLAAEADLAKCLTTLPTLFASLRGASSSGGVGGGGAVGEFCFGMSAEELVRRHEDLIAEEREGLFERWLNMSTFALAFFMDSNLQAFCEALQAYRARCKQTGVAVLDPRVRFSEFLDRLKNKNKLYTPAPAMVPAILRSFKLPKDFNLALDPEDDQNQLAHLDPSMHDFKAIPQAVIEPLTRLLKFNYSCMTQLLRSAVHSSVLSNTRSIVRAFANALLQPDGLMYQALHMLAYEKFFRRNESLPSAISNAVGGEFLLSPISSELIDLHVGGTFGDPRAGQLAVIRELERKMDAFFDCALQHLCLEDLLHDHQRVAFLKRNQKKRGREGRNSGQVRHSSQTVADGPDVVRLCSADELPGAAGEHPKRTSLLKPSRLRSCLHLLLAELKLDAAVDGGGSTDFSPENTSGGGAVRAVDGRRPHHQGVSSTTGQSRRGHHMGANAGLSRSSSAGKKLVASIGDTVRAAADAHDASVAVTEGRSPHFAGSRRRLRLPLLLPAVDNSAASSKSQTKPDRDNHSTTATDGSRGNVGAGDSEDDSDDENAVTPRSTLSREHGGFASSTNNDSSAEASSGRTDSNPAGLKKKLMKRRLSSRNLLDALKQKRRDETFRVYMSHEFVEASLKFSFQRLGVISAQMQSQPVSPIVGATDSVGCGGGGGGITQATEAGEFFDYTRAKLLRSRVRAPLLQVKLTVRDGKAVFSPSFSEMEALLLQEVHRASRQLVARAKCYSLDQFYKYRFNHREFDASGLDPLCPLPEPESSSGTRRRTGQDRGSDRLHQSTESQASMPESPDSDEPTPLRTWTKTVLARLVDVAKYMAENMVLNRARRFMFVFQKNEHALSERLDALHLAFSPIPIVSFEIPTNNSPRTSPTGSPRQGVTVGSAEASGRSSPTISPEDAAKVSAGILKEIKSKVHCYDFILEQVQFDFGERPDLGPPPTRSEKSKQRPESTSRLRRGRSYGDLELFQMFAINTAEFKSKLSARVQMLKSGLCASVASYAERICTHVSASYARIAGFLSQAYRTPYHVFKVQAFLAHELQGIHDELQRGMRDPQFGAGALLFFVLNLGFAPRTSTVLAFRNALKWFVGIQRYTEDAWARVASRRKYFDEYYSGLKSRLTNRLLALRHRAFGSTITDVAGLDDDTATRGEKLTEALHRDYTSLKHDLFDFMRETRLLAVEVAQMKEHLPEVDAVLQEPLQVVLRNGVRGDSAGPKRGLSRSKSWKEGSSKARDEDAVRIQVRKMARRRALLDARWNALPENYDTEFIGTMLDVEARLDGFQNYWALLRRVQFFYAAAYEAPIGGIAVDQMVDKANTLHAESLALTCNPNIDGLILETLQGAQRKHGRRSIQRQLSKKQTEPKDDVVGEVEGNAADAVTATASSSSEAPGPGGEHVVDSVPTTKVGVIPFLEMFLKEHARLLRLVAVQEWKGHHWQTIQTEVELAFIEGDDSAVSDDDDENGDDDIQFDADNADSNTVENAAEEGDAVGSGGSSSSSDDTGNSSGSDSDVQTVYVLSPPTSPKSQGLRSVRGRLGHKANKASRRKGSRGRGRDGSTLSMYHVAQAAFLRLKTAQRRVHLATRASRNAPALNGGPGDMERLSPSSTLPELIAFMEAHPRSAFVFENVNRCAVSEFRCSTQLNELYTQRMVMGCKIVTFVPRSAEDRGRKAGFASLRKTASHRGVEAPLTDEFRAPQRGANPGSDDDDDSSWLFYRLNSDALEQFVSACGLQVERLLAFSNSSDNARYFAVFEQLRTQIKRTSAHLQSLVKLMSTVLPVLRTAKALVQEQAVGANMTSSTGNDSTAKSTELSGVGDTMRHAVRAVNALMACFCVLGSGFDGGLQAATAKAGNQGGGQQFGRMHLDLESIAKQIAIAASDWNSHKVTAQDMENPTFYSIYGITRGVDALNPHASKVDQTLDFLFKKAYALTTSLRGMVSNALIQPMRMLCPRLWFVEDALVLRMVASVRSASDLCGASPEADEAAHEEGNERLPASSFLMQLFPGTGIFAFKFGIDDENHNSNVPDPFGELNSTPELESHGKIEQRAESIVGVYTTANIGRGDKDMQLLDFSRPLLLKRNSSRTTPSGKVVDDEGMDDASSKLHRENAGSKSRQGSLFFLADWINHIEEAIFVATKTTFVSFTHQALSHVEDPRAFNCCTFIDQYALGLKRVAAMPTQAVLLASQATWTFTLERELLQLTAGFPDAAAAGVTRIVAQVKRSLENLAAYRRRTVTTPMFKAERGTASLGGSHSRNSSQQSSASKVHVREHSELSFGSEDSDKTPDSDKRNNGGADASSERRRRIVRQKSTTPKGTLLLPLLDAFIAHRGAQLEATAGILQRLKVAVQQKCDDPAEFAWGYSWRVYLTLRDPTTTTARQRASDLSSVMRRKNLWIRCHDVSFPHRYNLATPALGRSLPFTNAGSKEAYDMLVSLGALEREFATGIKAPGSKAPSHNDVARVDAGTPAQTKPLGHSGIIDNGVGKSADPLAASSTEANSSTDSYRGSVAETSMHSTVRPLNHAPQLIVGSHAGQLCVSDLAFQLGVRVEVFSPCRQIFRNNLNGFPTAPLQHFLRGVAMLAAQGLWATVDLSNVRAESEARMFFRATLGIARSVADDYRSLHSAREKVLASMDLDGYSRRPYKHASSANVVFVSVCSDASFSRSHVRDLVDAFHRDVRSAFLGAASQLPTVYTQIPCTANPVKDALLILGAPLLTAETVVQRVNDVLDWLEVEVRTSSVLPEDSARVWLRYLRPVTAEFGNTQSVPPLPQAGSTHPRKSSSNTVVIRGDMHFRKLEIIAQCIKDACLQRQEPCPAMSAVGVTDRAAQANDAVHGSSSAPSADSTEPTAQVPALGTSILQHGVANGLSHVRDLFFSGEVDDRVWSFILQHAVCKHGDNLDLGGVSDSVTEANASGIFATSPVLTTFAAKAAALTEAAARDREVVWNHSLAAAAGQFMDAVRKSQSDFSAPNAVTEKGKFAALVGPISCGKSTFLAVCHHAADEARLDYRKDYSAQTAALLHQSPLHKNEAARLGAAGNGSSAVPPEVHTSPRPEKRSDQRRKIVRIFFDALPLNTVFGLSQASLSGAEGGGSADTALEGSFLASMLHDHSLTHASRDVCLWVVFDGECPYKIENILLNLRTMVLPLREDPTDQPAFMFELVDLLHASPSIIESLQLFSVPPISDKKDAPSEARVFFDSWITSLPLSAAVLNNSNIDMLEVGRLLSTIFDFVFVPVINLIDGAATAGQQDPLHRLRPRSFYPSSAAAAGRVAVQQFVTQASMLLTAASFLQPDETPARRRSPAAAKAATSVDTNAMGDTERGRPGSGHERGHNASSATSEDVSIVLSRMVEVAVYICVELFESDDDQLAGSLAISAAFRQLFGSEAARDVHSADTIGASSPQSFKCQEHFVQKMQALFQLADQASRPLTHFFFVQDCWVPWGAVRSEFWAEQVQHSDRAVFRGSIVLPSMSAYRFKQLQAFYGDDREGKRRPGKHGANIATLVIGPGGSGKSDLGLSMLTLKMSNSSVVYIPLSDSSTCSGLRGQLEGANEHGVSSFENTNGVLQCKSNTAHSCYVFIDDLHCSPRFVEKCHDPTLEISGIEILRSYVSSVASPDQHAVEKGWLAVSGKDVASFHHGTKVFATLNSTAFDSWQAKPCFGVERPACRSRAFKPYFNEDSRGFDATNEGQEETESHHSRWSIQRIVASSWVIHTRGYDHNECCSVLAGCSSLTGSLGALGVKGLVDEISTEIASIQSHLSHAAFASRVVPDLGWRLVDFQNVCKAIFGLLIDVQQEASVPTPSSRSATPRRRGAKRRQASLLSSKAVIRMWLKYFCLPKRSPHLLWAEKQQLRLYRSGRTDLVPLAERTSKSSAENQDLLVHYAFSTLWLEEKLVNVLAAVAERISAAGAPFPMIMRYDALDGDSTGHGDGSNDEAARPATPTRSRRFDRRDAPVHGPMSAQSEKSLAETIREFLRGLVGCKTCVLLSESWSRAVDVVTHATGDPVFAVDTVVLRRGYLEPSWRHVLRNVKEKVLSAERKSRINSGLSRKRTFGRAKDSGANKGRLAGNAVLLLVDATQFQDEPALWQRLSELCRSNSCHLFDDFEKASVEAASATETDDAKATNPSNAETDGLSVSSADVDSIDGMTNDSAAAGGDDVTNSTDGARSTATATDSRRALILDAKQNLWLEHKRELHTAFQNLFRVVLYVPAAVRPSCMLAPSLHKPPPLEALRTIASLWPSLKRHSLVLFDHSLDCSLPMAKRLLGRYLPDDLAERLMQTDSPPKSVSAVPSGVVGDANVDVREASSVHRLSPSKLSRLAFLVFNRLVSLFLHKYERITVGFRMLDFFDVFKRVCAANHRVFEDHIVGHNNMCIGVLGPLRRLKAGLMEQQLNKHDALHHKRLRSFQRASISAALAKQNAERSQSELDETKLKLAQLDAELADLQRSRKAQEVKFQDARAQALSRIDHFHVGADALRILAETYVPGHEASNAPPVVVTACNFLLMILGACGQVVQSLQPMGMDNRAAVVSHARGSDFPVPQSRHRQQDSTGTDEATHASSRDTASGHARHVSQSQQLRSSHDVHLSEDELDHHVLDVAAAYRNAIARQEVQTRRNLLEEDTAATASSTPADKNLDNPAEPARKETDAAAKEKQQEQEASQAAEAEDAAEAAAANLATTPWWDWPSLSLEWPQLQELLRTPSLMDSISRALAKHTSDSLFAKCVDKLLTGHSEFFASPDWEQAVTQKATIHAGSADDNDGHDGDATASAERVGVSDAMVVAPRLLETFVHKLGDVGAPPVLGKVFSTLSDLTRGFHFWSRSKELKQLERSCQAKRDDLETDVAILSAQNVGLTKVHRQVQVRLKFESAQSRSTRRKLTFLQQLRGRLDSVDLQSPVFDHWKAFANEDVALKAMPALPSYAVLRAALVVSGGATDEAFRAELAEYWLECCQLLSIPTFVERGAAADTTGSQTKHTEPPAVDEPADFSANRTSLRFTSGLFVQTQAYRLCGDGDGRFVHCLTRHDALLDAFSPRPKSAATAAVALTQRLKTSQLDESLSSPKYTAAPGAVKFGKNKTPMDFFGLERGVDAVVFHHLIFDRRRLIRVCGDHPIQNLADLRFCGQRRQLELAAFGGTDQARVFSPSSSPRSPLRTPRSALLAGAPRAGSSISSGHAGTKVVCIYFLPPNISRCRRTLFCGGIEMPRVWLSTGSSSPKKGNACAASPLMLLLRAAAQQGSEVIVHAAYLDSDAFRNAPGSASDRQQRRHDDDDDDDAGAEPSPSAFFEDHHSLQLVDNNAMYQEVDTATVAAFFSLLQELTSSGQQTTALKFSWHNVAPESQRKTEKLDEAGESSVSIHSNFRLVLYHEPDFDAAIFASDVSCVHLATPVTSRLRFAHDALAQCGDISSSSDKVGARQRPGALWETMLDLRDLVTHDGKVLSTRESISQHCYDWGGISASNIFDIDQRALDRWVDLVGAHAQATKARDQLAMRVARKNHHAAGANVSAHELALVSWANLCFVTLQARNHCMSAAHSADSLTSPLHLRAQTGQQLVDFLFTEGEAHVKSFEPESGQRSKLRSSTRSTADRAPGGLDSPCLVDWACFVKVLCAPQALTMPQSNKPPQAALSAVQSQRSRLFTRSFKATALVLALYWVADEPKVGEREIWLFASGGCMQAPGDVARQQRESSSQKQRGFKRLCDMIQSTTAKGIESLVLRLSGGGGDGGSAARSSSARRGSPAFLEILLQQPSFERLRKKFEAGNCQGFVDAVQFWSNVKAQATTTTTTTTTATTNGGGGGGKAAGGAGKKVQNARSARVQESPSKVTELMPSRQNEFRAFAERMRLALGSALQSLRGSGGLSKKSNSADDAFECVSSLGSSTVSQRWWLHILKTWRLGLILFATVPATDDALVMEWILNECFSEHHRESGSSSSPNIDAQTGGGGLSADELCVLRVEVWKSFRAQRHFAFSRPLHRRATWHRLQANNMYWGSTALLGRESRRSSSSSSPSVVVPNTAVAGTNGFLFDFSDFLSNWIRKHQEARDRLSVEQQKSAAIPLQHLVLFKLTQQAGVLVEFGLAVGRVCGLPLQSLLPKGGGERAQIEHIRDVWRCFHTLRPVLLQDILACGMQLPTEGHRVWLSLLIRLDELTRQQTKDLMSRVSTGMTTTNAGAAREIAAGSQSDSSQRLVTLDHWWERIVALMQKMQW